MKTKNMFMLLALVSAFAGAETWEDELAKVEKIELKADDTLNSIKDILIALGKLGQSTKDLEDLAALKDKQDTHSRQIETLGKEAVDNGKMLGNVVKSFNKLGVTVDEASKENERNKS